MVFGSVGIPRDEFRVFAAWITLSAGPPRHEKIEIQASRAHFSNNRPADVENDVDRIWTFSGRLPPGQYLIEGASIQLIAQPPAPVFRRIPFEPPLTVSVASGGTVYLGRWTTRLSVLTKGLDARSRPGDLLVWDDPVFSVGLRNAFDEDSAIMARHRIERKGVPLMPGVTTNPLDGLKPPASSSGGRST